MKKKLSILFFCKLFKDHKWTSAGLRGEELKLDHDMNGAQITATMKEYNRMYCERCGYNSKLNDRVMLNSLQKLFNY